MSLLIQKVIMANGKRGFGEIFTAVVVSAGAIGVGALVVDWLKAMGKWPGPKAFAASPPPPPSDAGADPVVQAGKRVL